MFMRTFSLLALLALPAACLPERRDEPPAPTTAPFYLPYYDKESWSIVRGSILDVNTAASETTYTIFCPDQQPPVCDISLEFPFVVVEGPGTVHFHGTYTSTYIAELGCQLAGRTAATCSGYSSYRAGYTNAYHTGPTEVRWTKTLTGSQVQWGVLTLTETPTATRGDLGATATGNFIPRVPDPDEGGANSSARAHGLWILLATASSVVVVTILL